MIRLSIAYTLNILFFLTILLAMISPVQADIYKYKDKDGVLRFTNTRPAGKKSLKSISGNANPKERDFFQRRNTIKLLPKRPNGTGYCSP